MGIKFTSPHLRTKFWIFLLTLNYCLQVCILVDIQEVLPATWLIKVEVVLNSVNLWNWPTSIRLNPQLQEHIRECYEHINPVGINAPILISQKGTVFSVQRINIILKEVKKKYRLKIKNFSCHSLRKTFGRQVYNMNSDNAELALVKLMELFNHSSVAITKRYLGLRQEEILQTYDCLSF